MKKYDIKTTDKETLKKWFYLMTLGRALDEKAPAYLLQSLGWSYHAPYDMTGFNLRSGRFSKREKISCSPITGTCSRYYRPE